MSKGLIFGGFVVIALAIGGFLLNAYFTANQYETDVIASYETEQAAMSEWQIVTAMQAEVKVQADSIDIQKLKIMFEQKSNSAGVKPDASVLALFNGANMSSGHDLSERLMTTIDGKYAKYQDKQNTRIDRDRTYQNFLKSSTAGAIAKALFGFPNKNYTDKELSRTVKTSKTEETYEKKIIEQPKLFNTK